MTDIKEQMDESTDTEPLDQEESKSDGFFKNKKNLPKLLKLYKEKIKEANTDLSTWTDIMTRPGAEIRVNAAKQESEKIYQEIINTINNNSGAIFLTGDLEKVSSFVDIAKKETKGNICLVFAGEMIHELSEKVDASLNKDRRVSIEVVGHIMSSLMELLDRLKVASIPAPNFGAYMGAILPTIKEVKEMIEGLLSQNNIKDLLNAIYIQELVIKKVMSEDLSSPFMRVIVLGAFEEEADGVLFKSLYGGRNTAFYVREEASRSVVLKVFQALKAKRKEN